ncbi:inter-alpha-trypsin inhibitor heavy chain H5-like [Brienomyrus brachyistius]|uniref:inter-alpha-trypsin inhibitor heavy chain H5-like n=1 Tax=Brienomyrus brachyistius TaxID=42636 RepID=UPI0020B411D6|nr:inter-alpha-trypsin inhibitor heavy chain H5-like [Brienomyrus brachyistius]
MRAFILFVCFGPLVWGQQRDSGDGNDVTSRRRLDFAPGKEPTQMKLSLAKEKKPLIQELSVKTTIISRYAFTAVSCTMVNIYSAAIKGVFQIEFPASAFVSNFTRIIAGRVYPSQIKEKKAKGGKERDSQPPKEEQSGAGQGEVETFQASALIPGKNRAVFLLTYEELLVRRRGLYEHVTSIRPLQVVNKLSVQVTIVEQSKITHLEVLPLRKRTPTNDHSAGTQGKTAPPASTVIQQNTSFCKISFNPSIIQQHQIASSGILGDFVVQYDVERELPIGDVQVLDGHFVHYFAPKNLPVVPKNVVFVIDTSASMVGTKIRQTKEALFTILRDLRPNDHFNFVSFSNRIKVWKPDQLVPVTPDNIRDAKKFIYLASPSGGTDINRALETGSTLLSSYLSSQDRNRNSVSLLIFLTDGRPTVGEVKPPRILSNARSSVRGGFCVFTIGLGDDVDYRLLERLSLENCGTMRRIPEQADASGMLKGFYDEIGTPLLSDVRVAYDEDAVEYVTQQTFSNYFNGSEIVIAGKLTNQSAESLHVQVLANSSEGGVVLETDVPLQERERKLQQHIVEAGLDSKAENYAERAFGFLSVKESLKSRLLSQTSQDRVEATKKATNLSLAYNFLTPLTSITSETPNTLVQEVIPDSAIELSAHTSEEITQSTQGGAELSALKKPEEELVKISKTSADGDPHFMVDFPLNKLTMCFNINGEPGQVLRLVSDSKHSGVTVNGKLIGAPAPTGAHKKKRTYFSTITVMVDRPRRSYVEVTPYQVIVDGTDHFILPVNTTVSVEKDELVVAIVEQSNVTITVQGNIGFLVVIHQFRNPAPFQRDHLGFYMTNSKGLSENSHGLLGQFLYQEVGLVQMPMATTAPMQPDAFSRKREVPEKMTANDTQPDIPTKMPPELTKTTQLTDTAELKTQIQTTHPTLDSQSKVLTSKNSSEENMLTKTLPSQHPLKMEHLEFLEKTSKLDTKILQDKTPAKTAQLEVLTNSVRYRRSTGYMSSMVAIEPIQLKVSTNTTQSKGPPNTNTTQSKGPPNTNTTQSKGPPNTNTTQSKGPPNTNTTQSKGPPNTNTTQSKGPPNTVTTQSKGPPNTVTTQSKGPPNTVTMQSKGPPNTMTTQSKGPPNTNTTQSKGSPNTNTTQSKGPPSTNTTQSKSPLNTNTTQSKGPPNTNTTQSKGPPNTVTTQSKGPPTTNTTQSNSPPSTNTTQSKSPLNTNTTQSNGPPSTNTTQSKSPLNTNTTQSKGPPNINTTQSNGPPNTNTTQSKGPSNTNTTQSKGPPNTNTTQSKGPPNTVTTKSKGPPNTTQSKGPPTRNTTQSNGPPNTNTTQSKGPPTRNTTQSKGAPNTVTTKSKGPPNTTQSNGPPNTNITQSKGPPNTVTTKSKGPPNTTQSKGPPNTVTTKSKGPPNTTQSNGPPNTNTTQSKNPPNTIQSKGPPNTTQSKGPPTRNTTQSKGPPNTVTTQSKGPPNTNTTQSKGPPNTTQSKGPPNTVTTQSKGPPNTNTTQSKGPPNTTQSKGPPNTNTTQSKGPPNTNTTQSKGPPNTNTTQCKGPPNTMTTQSKDLSNKTDSISRFSSALSRNATLSPDEYILSSDGTFTALHIKGHILAVTKKTRRIYSSMQIVDCWFIKNSATKLIDGQYGDYVVSDLYDTSPGPHGNN